MKRQTMTLAAIVAIVTVAIANAVATPAASAQDGRFVLSSAAATPVSRADVSTALPSSVPRLAEKQDTTFSIGLEALKWLGATSHQVGVPYPDLWCADFVNFILRRTGHPTTNSRAARSFLDYGRRVDRPIVGSIVVLTRGPNGGHVGIVRGTDGAGRIVVISGNHGNRVAESTYPKSRVLGYVVPPSVN